MTDVSSGSFGTDPDSDPLSLSHSDDLEDEQAAFCELVSLFFGESEQRLLESLAHVPLAGTTPSFVLSRVHAATPETLLDQFPPKGKGWVLLLVDGSAPEGSPEGVRKLGEDYKRGGVGVALVVALPHDLGTQGNAGDRIQEFLEAGADDVVQRPLLGPLLLKRAAQLWAAQRQALALDCVHAHWVKELAIVRHEFATPLSVLQMSLAALKKPDPGEDRLEATVERCERQVTKILAIIDRLRKTGSNPKSHGDR